MQFTIKGQTIKVNVPTWATLEARVSERLAQRKGFALATINLDHLVKLRASAEFRRAYSAQDLITADGNPIVWMSRLAGRQVSLIPGSDAILPLARIAASDKAAGILALDHDVARTYRDWGAQFLAVGIDVLMLAHAARATMDRWRDG